jgi:hypothetical protein
MNYKRVFTFGCSFTNWIWPTWADIIAVQTGLPVYNGALAGLGNVGISYRMYEYDMKYNFTPDDLILVMWTGWSREDRYLNNQWKLCGNIFNNDFYDKHFIKKYWSWENDIIKNASSIAMSNRAFTIAENFSCWAYTDVEIGKEVRYETDIKDTYVKHLPEPILFKFNESYNFNKKCFDGHPDIVNHVDFYNNNISNKFNFPRVEQTNQLYEWQEDLENQLPQTSNQDQHVFIKEYFRTRNHYFSKT